MSNPRKECRTRRYVALPEQNRIMLNVLLKLRSFFVRLCKSKYKIIRSSDEPRHIRACSVYLIGEGGLEWSAIMMCPCGCRETIRLNLIPASDRPVWKIRREKNGTATITPSVWRQVGCRSHFVLRSGEIRWHD